MTCSPDCPPAMQGKSVAELHELTAAVGAVQRAIREAPPPASGEMITKAVDAAATRLAASPPWPDLIERLRGLERALRELVDKPGSSQLNALPGLLATLGSLDKTLRRDNRHIFGYDQAGDRRWRCQARPTVGCDLDGAADDATLAADGQRLAGASEFQRADCGNQGHCRRTAGERAGHFTADSRQNSMPS